MDWMDSITEWHTVAPEFPETVSDADRAVEEWEEEFMDSAQEDYDKVSPEQYWARYGTSQDLCGPDIRTMTRSEFDRL